MKTFLKALLLTIIMFSITYAGESNGQNTVSTVKLKGPGGNEFDIYVAGPEDAKAGILIVHDWFGVSDMTKETVAVLAEKHYRVAAVDLYNGHAAKTHKEAYKNMLAVKPEEANAKLREVIRYLKSPDRRLATMGFSFGTVYALSANLQQPDEISATVLFYGDYEKDVAKLKTLKSPVLMIMGSKDDPKSACQFQAKMDSVGQSAEIYIYPGAKHAFAQPLFNNGANFDATAKRVSWMLAEDFLQRHLVQE